MNMRGNLRGSLRGNIKGESSLPVFDKDSIVFAGQSNMVGQGSASPTYYTSFENFALDDVVKPYADPYCDTTGTVYGTVFNNSSPNTGCVGYAMDYIVSNTGNQMISIPACKGGTGFAAGDWSSGADHELGLIDRINKAKLFSNVKTIVWWQGEDDADEGSSTAQYESDFATFKANVEAGTGLTFTWIVVKLHQWHAGIPISQTNWVNIQTAQQNIADSYADVYLADASSILGNSSDRIHLDDDGLLAMGSRIGKLICQTTYGILNPDMMYANDAAFYYDFDKDDKTVVGGEITAITPTLTNGLAQNVGTTGRLPTFETGINGLGSMGVRADGLGFIRHQHATDVTKTVFLLGTVPTQSGGNYLFSLGTTASGSTTRALSLTGSDNLFIRNDAGGAESLKNPIDNPQDFIIAIRWNSETSVDVWFNNDDGSTPDLSFDPESISAYDRAWIGARDSSGTVDSIGSPIGLQYAVAYMSERSLTDIEVENCIKYLGRYGEVTEAVGTIVTNNGQVVTNNGDPVTT